MARKITLAISGMECPNCAMILERIEDKVQGVQMAEASYRKERLMIEYDERQVTEEQLKAEVQRMGYVVKAVIARS